MAEEKVLGSLNQQLDQKKKAKFDPEKVAEARAWIEAVLGDDSIFSGDPSCQTEFHKALQSGVVLCKLINKIKPGSIPRFKKKKKLAPFVQRENISLYLEACKKLPKYNANDNFVTNDLHTPNNIILVYDQIHTLGGICFGLKDENGDPFPPLGNKHSDKNERQFTKEQIIEGRKIVPLQNAGSIEVAKEKGTDHIVRYAKAGTELGVSVGGVSQQNAGSIKVEKEKGTDHIVRYGKAGAELGKSVGGVSQQNAGSIKVEKETGTDHIVRYGKAGAELGKSVGGFSQQNAGSIKVEKEKGVDHIVMYANAGAELGNSVGGVSQQNAGSLETDKGGSLDQISRVLN